MNVRPLLVERAGIGQSEIEALGGKERITRGDFDTQEWVYRLATALPRLATAREPFLENYWPRHTRTDRTTDGRGVIPFPLDYVLMICTSATYSRHC